MKLQIFLILALLLTGCASVDKDYFIRTEPLDSANYEYLGDIIVHKEGFSFLWCIPFKSATDEATQQLMIEKAKWGFPDSCGVYEYTVTERQEVALFDWTPRLYIKAKVVKKR
ncbi:MAG: hypothetical protein KBC30_03425 [Planctomycetes bacterium]|nr:hypothetical protein [Planctomycetota bacterium]HON43897.1 hypothetical protein [Planctomycetota bacterium]HPY73916.1 hypothetical protein [Planctomycetota bacterium]HQA99539.1 hypothetical protein [Planctomycetota bacterium]HRU51201.1 hypothetical protein [Planctomycetota bacterium]